MVCVLGELGGEGVDFFENYKPAAVGSALNSKLVSANRTVLWKAPPAGQSKLNVDAAVTEEVDKYAIGVVFRNDKGEVVFSAALVYILFRGCESM